MTLIEVLIALFVFAIVIAIAGSGIVQALRVQSLNETNASLQGKLRRITEVVSQDLRSAVLGAITNAPYATGNDAVSFTLAEGGQGYAVLRSAGVNINQFPNASDFRVVAEAANAAQLGLVGQRVLLVNGAGTAASYVVTSAVSDGVVGNNRWILGHAGCLNAIAWVDPMRMFAVDAVGYRLDNSGDLMRQLGGAAEGALAFDISEFVVQYVYRDATGTVEVRDAPYMAGGLPLRVSGTNVLDSLRIRVASEQPSFGNRMIERSYTAQIAMPASGSVNLRSVVTCP